VHERTRRVDLACPAAFKLAEEVLARVLHAHVVHYLLVGPWGDAAALRDLVEPERGLAHRPE